jgi:segregation and condensation protein B
VGRVEVDSIRGVDSSGVMRTLFEANMVRMVGRSEGVGRPMMFGTTKEFMVHFGLKSLADLPKPKELEELLAEGARRHGAAAATRDTEEQVDRDQEHEAVEIDAVDAADSAVRPPPSQNGATPSPAAETADDQ